MQLDVVLDRPLKHRAGGVFRPVVDAQATGIAADGGDLVERADHAPTCKREIRIDREPLTAEAILDRQRGVLCAASAGALP